MPFKKRKENEADQYNDSIFFPTGSLEMHVLSFEMKWRKQTQYNRRNKEDAFYRHCEG